LTDLFSAVELGEAILTIAEVSYKCESAVTKGQVVVADTHTAQQLVSIATAGAAATDAVGVAMKSGSAGDYIPVLRIGQIKVTASGSITAGEKVRCAASGKVQAMPTTPTAGNEKQQIGRAEQNATDGDELIIFVNV